MRWHTHGLKYYLQEMRETKFLRHAKVGPTADGGALPDFPNPRWICNGGVSAD